MRRHARRGGAAHPVGRTHGSGASWPVRRPGADQPSVARYGGEMTASPRANDNDRRGPNDGGRPGDADYPDTSGDEAQQRTRAEAADRLDPLAGFRERFVIDDDDLIYLDGNSLGR